MVFFVRRMMESTGQILLIIYQIPSYYLLELNSNDSIFAGTNWGGVFHSTDNGNYWNEINSGLRNLNVMSFSFDSSGFIYAGTFAGVYRSVNSTITKANEISNLPLNFSLSQNYPNPFNPTTNIKYQLSEISKVKLTVYDILGREVKTLVNEEKPAGTYELEFNGTKSAKWDLFLQN